ncbi:MAG: hypothetical protein ACNS63_09735 [Candidatus Nitrospinota bacterium M3_3B_026]
MELLYVLVHLADGAAEAWSSSRGRIDTRGRPWRDVFDLEPLAAREPQARAMIHLAGDSSAVGDEEREALMTAAREAGYGSVRIETGEPLSPEEAFQIMPLPFT